MLALGYDHVIISFKLLNKIKILCCSRINHNRLKGGSHYLQQRNGHNWVTDISVEKCKHYIHGLQSLPPSPKRAERKGRRRPFREAGSGHKQWNTVSCVDTFSIISKFSAQNSKI